MTEINTKTNWAFFDRLPKPIRQYLTICPLDEEHLQGMIALHGKDKLVQIIQGLTPEQLRENNLPADYFTNTETAE